jgi:hypothetical protein
VVYPSTANITTPTTEQLQHVQLINDDAIEQLIEDDVINQIHAALGKTLYINQSCYDKTTKIWLVYSTQLDSDNIWKSGWYYEYADNISTIQLGNNTSILINAVDIFNIPVNANITNLNCKFHNN